MKKEHKDLLIAILASAIITAAIAVLIVTSNKTPAISTVNVSSASNIVASATVEAQTNAPSQIDLLAAEVRALKVANEEREAKVKRLPALNEKVRREREMVTNVVTVPINIIVTNSPPAVNINGTLNIGTASAPQASSKESKKGGAALMEKTRTPKTRVPMYVVTNTTSSVTTTGTNVSSVVNTQTQSFLKPQRRWSLMGLVFGEKDPIPTTVPSGQSVQQGYPAPQVVVVEQPAYGYSYGYGYPYRYAPTYNQLCERRLFGVRFHTR